MRLLTIPLLIAFTIGTTSLAAAQTPSGNEGAEQSASAPKKIGEPASLVFWNRQIIVFRSYYENLSPSERADRALTRLEELPQTSREPIIQANQTTSGQYQGALVTVDGRFVFAILTQDLDPESQESLQTVSDDAIKQVRLALEARDQQRHWQVILKATVVSVIATILLLGGLWLVVRGGRAGLDRLNRNAKIKLKPLSLRGFDIRPVLVIVNRSLVKLFVWSTGVLFVYVWLAFVLTRFPYSQPWGQQLGGFLVNLFEGLGSGILRSLPGIFTVVVVFLLARIVAKVFELFFTEVEQGRLKSSWFYSDTARATRRLVAVLIWIFAITVAYPYIPGSSTDAFKGISVFVGLMISLGSAGLVNQVMSGLVVIYSRALHPGEFVKIGNDIGTVTDVGMLSTKILTVKREEITIPNAVLVSTTTVNYSRQSVDQGALVGTTVTIGYDAPWRLVHEMLLHAADQTEGVRKDPCPVVWQKALSDFFVEYELIVSLDRPADRIRIQSELHTHIQDAFNEQGVQIMSPHFVSQPGEKVFVPKTRWFASGNSPVKMGTE